MNLYAIRISQLDEGCLTIARATSEEEAGGMFKDAFLSGNLTADRSLIERAGGDAIISIFRLPDPDYKGLCRRSPEAMKFSRLSDIAPRDSSLEWPDESDLAKAAEEENSVFMFDYYREGDLNYQDFIAAEDLKTAEEIFRNDLAHDSFEVFRLPARVGDPAIILGLEGVEMSRRPEPDEPGM